MAPDGLFDYGEGGTDVKARVVFAVHAMMELDDLPGLWKDAKLLYSRLQVIKVMHGVACRLLGRDILIPLQTNPVLHGAVRHARKTPYTAVGVVTV